MILCNLNRIFTSSQVIKGHLRGTCTSGLSRIQKQSAGIVFQSITSLKIKVAEVEADKQRGLPVIVEGSTTYILGTNNKTFTIAKYSMGTVRYYSIRIFYLLIPFNKN